MDERSRDELDSLFSTLDICEEFLPFDLHQAHIKRLETIRTILKQHEPQRPPRPPAQVLYLAARRPDGKEREL